MFHDTENFKSKRSIIRTMAKKGWGESKTFKEDPSLQSTPTDSTQKRSTKRSSKKLTKGSREHEPTRSRAITKKKSVNMFKQTNKFVKILGIIIFLMMILAATLCYLYLYIDFAPDDNGLPEVLEDSDDDGLDDTWEVTHELDPNNPDTDDDGMPDGWEVQFDLAPKDPNDAELDADLDGFDQNQNEQLDINEYYTNLEEYQHGTNPKNPDTDGDGMSDGWEIYYLYKCLELKDNILKYNPPGKREYNYTLDPTNPTDADQDIDVDHSFHFANDGLTNLQEFLNRTDPTRPDTDGDNLTDFDELVIYGTNPLKLDTDGDGLYDGWEVKFGSASVGLSPISNDTNGNSVPDTREDLDNDSLYNLLEFHLGTSPVDPDTDGDCLPDDWEEEYRTKPISQDASGDPDNDGLTNLLEFSHWTDPNNPDTDGDGLTDGDELILGFPGMLIKGIYYSTPDTPRYFTNATNNDTDSDGIPDGQEVIKGEDGYITNATNNDTDGDEVYDKEEIDYGDDGFITNPTNIDTDGDWLTDKYEIDAFLNRIVGYDTTPTSKDRDGDGLLDGEEILTDFHPFSNYDPNLYGRIETGFVDTIFGRVNTDAIDGTDPTNPDTDGDGMSDGWETKRGFANRSQLSLIQFFDNLYKRTDYYNMLINNNEVSGVWLVNPLDHVDHDEDPDHDGYDHDGDKTITGSEEFRNVDEFKWQTDPLGWDSDQDGMSDGWEVAFFSSEFKSPDPTKDDHDLDNDNDGVVYYINNKRYQERFTNLKEYRTGVDLNKDGIIDHGTTDPNYNDSYYRDAWFADDDGDGLVNGWELIFNGTTKNSEGYTPYSVMPGLFDPTKKDSDGLGEDDGDADYDKDGDTNLQEQFTEGRENINDIMNAPGCSDPTDPNMTPKTIKLSYTSSTSSRSRSSSSSTSSSTLDNLDKHDETKHSAVAVSEKNTLSTIVSFTMIMMNYRERFILSDAVKIYK